MATLDRVEPSEPDALIGVTLGNYVVQRQIGQGGVGVVYLAHQPDIGKAVAIKVLRPDIASDPDQVKVLVQEARTVGAIRHRGIIDVFGFGTTPQGQQYIVMEYLEGEPLDEYLRHRKTLGAAEVVALLDEILAAVGAAHGAGVVHRDLKPGNIFLAQQSDGTRYVKVLDFGLAKKLSQPHGWASQTGLRAAGTPAYVAPEQALGENVGPLTDLYSLGAMAYELLTGEIPFSAPSLVGIMMMHVSDPPPRARAKAPSVPAELEALVLELMDKKPELRPQSAAQVRLRLKQIARDLAESDTQVGVLPYNARRPVASGTPRAEQREAERSTLSGPVGLAAATPITDPGGASEPDPEASTGAGWPSGDVTLSRKVTARPAPGLGRWWWLIAAIGAVGLGGIAIAVSEQRTADENRAIQAQLMRLGDPAARLEGRAAAAKALLQRYPQRPEVQASVQKLSEELVQGGTEALQAGEFARADALLASALEIPFHPPALESLLHQARVAAKATGDGMVRVGAFWMDRYEYPNRAGVLPRVNVDFEEASRLCHVSGKRLCTEAEWQSACEGHQHRAFAYGGAYDAAACNVGGRRKGPAVAGSATGCVSEAGAFDLSGNVAEWTASPVQPGAPQRVVRGGNWRQSGHDVSCMQRDYFLPGQGGAPYLGFRCCF